MKLKYILIILFLWWGFESVEEIMQTKDLLKSSLLTFWFWVLFITFLISSFVTVIVGCIYLKIDKL